jgi:hypothetical protein
LKHTKEDILKYNTKRQAAERYDQFNQMMLGGALMSAYGYLGGIFQDLDHMETDERKYYSAAIAEHTPTLQTLTALIPEYEHDYQRALRLAQFAPNLNDEEVLLVLTLRDNVYSVYNLFAKGFSIQLIPLKELDDSIIEKIGNMRLKGVSGRLYHRIASMETEGYARS